MVSHSVRLSRYSLFSTVTTHTVECVLYMSWSKHVLESNGYMTDDGTGIRCGTCNGTGWLQEWSKDGKSPPTNSNIPCKQCNGTGKV